MMKWNMAYATKYILGFVSEDLGYFADTLHEERPISVYNYGKVHFVWIHPDFVLGIRCEWIAEISQPTKQVIR